MEQITHETGLKDIAQMDGVQDLPMSVRAPFASALQAEARGDHAKAEEKLAAAIAAEDELVGRTE